jgi:hypothetical protein
MVKRAIMRKSRAGEAHAADIWRRKDIVSNMSFLWRAYFGFLRDEKAGLAAFCARSPRRDGNAVAGELQALLP